jgi:hypothetical protein
MHVIFIEHFTNHLHNASEYQIEYQITFLRVQCCKTRPKQYYYATAQFYRGSL